MTPQFATRALPATGDPLRFAGARSQHNRRRKAIAEARRNRICRRLRTLKLHQRGWQSALAREFRVHRSTIGRDLVAIRQTARNVAENRRDQLAIMRQTIGEMLHENLSREMDDV